RARDIASSMMRSRSAAAPATISSARSLATRLVSSPARWAVRIASLMLVSTLLKLFRFSSRSSSSPSSCLIFSSRDSISSFIQSTVYCCELPVHRFFSVHILHLNLCLPVSVQSNQNTVLSLAGFCNQGIDDKTAEVPHRYDIAGFHYKRWLGNNRMIHLHFAFLHTALGF